MRNLCIGIVVYLASAVLLPGGAGEAAADKLNGPVTGAYLAENKSGGGAAHLGERVSVRGVASTATDGAADLTVAEPLFDGTFARRMFGVLAVLAASVFVGSHVGRRLDPRIGIPE